MLPETAPSAPAAASIEALIPEPQGADIGVVVARMVIENAFASRKQARHDRQHANAAMASAQKAQLQHMRAEADRRYEAAKLEAWGKISEGACGVAGGLTSGLGAAFGSDKAPAATQGYGSAMSSGGKVAGGVFNLISAGERHEADLASADAKAAEMEASAQKNRQENADDELKEAREHMRKAMDFLSEFQSTQSKSMSAAIRG
jgi:hypothetical protein